MTNNLKDNPGVIAPPPFIYLGAAIVGWLINFWFPMTTGLPRFPAILCGIVLIAFAGTIVAIAFNAFRRAETNIDPGKPTTAIVSTGIYGISRNPIYLSLTFLYAGVSLLTDSLWILLLLAPVLFVMHVGVIFREEEYLGNKFGDEYLRYKARVRRWL